MHVLIVPAIKLGVKGATSMGLSRIISGVVMTNTPIETRTQLYLVRIAAIGLTSLATKHVGDHTDQQIDQVVDMWKNRGDHIKFLSDTKENVEEAAKVFTSDTEASNQPPETV